MCRPDQEIDAKRSPGESVMPGFPFGPIRPNTRAGCRGHRGFLVPAVRRSLAVRVSGAAVAAVLHEGHVAITAPDAGSAGGLGARAFHSLSMDLHLNALVHLGPVSGLDDRFHETCVMDL